MFLIRALIFVLSAAVGLIAADLLLPGFRIDWADWWGFVLAVLIFAVLQSILSPWIATVAKRNAPALLGGIGIISTLIAGICQAYDNFLRAERLNLSCIYEPSSFFLLQKT